MANKDEILQLIKKSVSSTAPEAKLILYGSYARGDYNEDSDIDLLILIDVDTITNEIREKVTYPLYDIQFDKGILISPKMFTLTNWQTKQNITPFYYNVTKEGIML